MCGYPNGWWTHYHNVVHEAWRCWRPHKTDGRQHTATGMPELLLFCVMTPNTTNNNQNNLNVFWFLPGYHSGTLEISAGHISGWGKAKTLFFFVVCIWCGNVTTVAINLMRLTDSYVLRSLKYYWYLLIDCATKMRKIVRSPFWRKGAHEHIDIGFTELKYWQVLMHHFTKHCNSIKQLQILTIHPGSSVPYTLFTWIYTTAAAQPYRSPHRLRASSQLPVRVDMEKLSGID